MHIRTSNVKARRLRPLGFRTSAVRRPIFRQRCRDAVEMVALRLAARRRLSSLALVFALAGLLLPLSAVGQHYEGGWPWSEDAYRTVAAMQEVGIDHRATQQYQLDALARQAADATMHADRAHARLDAMVDSLGEEPQTVAEVRQYLESYGSEELKRLRFLREEVFRIRAAILASVRRELAGATSLATLPSVPPASSRHRLGFACGASHDHVVPSLAGSGPRTGRSLLSPTTSGGCCSESSRRWTL